MTKRSSVADVLSLKLDLDFSRTEGESIYPADVKPEPDDLEQYSKAGSLLSSDLNSPASSDAAASTRRSRGKFSPTHERVKRKVSVNFGTINKILKKKVNQITEDEFILPPNCVKMAIRQKKWKRAELPPLKVKVESSEEDEEEDLTTVVRMSDIAAAPFSPVNHQVRTEKISPATRVSKSHVQKAKPAHVTQTPSPRDSSLATKKPPNSQTPEVKSDEDAGDMERPKRVRKKKSLGDDFEVEEVVKVRRRSVAKKSEEPEKDPDESVQNSEDPEQPNSSSKRLTAGIDKLEPKKEEPCEQEAATSEERATPDKVFKRPRKSSMIGRSISQVKETNDTKSDRKSSTPVTSTSTRSSSTRRSITKEEVAAVKQEVEETPKEEEDKEEEEEEGTSTPSTTSKRPIRRSLPSSKVREIVNTTTKQTATNPNSALAIMQRLAAKETEKKDSKQPRKSFINITRQIRTPKDTRKPVVEESKDACVVKKDEPSAESTSEEPVKEDIKEEAKSIEDTVEEKSPTDESAVSEKAEDDVKEEEDEKTEDVTEGKKEGNNMEKEKKVPKLAFSLPKIPPDVKPSTPKTPKVATTPVAAQQPTRSSRRVPKPNKRFDDDYFTEPNVVAKSSSTSDVTEPVETEELELKVDVTPTHSVPSSSKTFPKRERLRFGVQANYVPSIKPVISPKIRSDGTIEHVAVVVNCVLDKLLLDVCQDGVPHHSLIMPKALQKQRAQDRAKYMKEKLAAIRPPKPTVAAPVLLSPTPTEELGGRKRKREAPKRDADFLYPTYKKEKKESSPANEVIASSNSPREPVLKLSKEKRALQNSIDYISKVTGDEMESIMKLAKEEEARNAEEEELKKKKKPAYSISLPEYMYRRNIGNIPDSGIRLYQDRNLVLDDPFYREFLIDYPENSHRLIVDDDMEINVDRVEEDEENNKMPLEAPSTVVKYHEEAEMLAEQVDMLLVRPRSYTGDALSLEDMLDKTNEQPESRRRLFRSAFEIITDQCLVETVDSRANLGQRDRDLYTKTVANATRLKNTYTMYNLDRQEAVFWTHRFFLENLQKHQLAAYLILLKYTKSMTCSYLSRIVRSTSDDPAPWPDVTKTVLQFCSVKMGDPEIELLNSTVPTGSMSDVVFLLVSPTMSFGETVTKQRSHESIFKWLRQMGHEQSEHIRISMEESNMSIADVPKKLYQEVSEKIREKLKTAPDCRIVLVGWGFTTFTCHHVVQTMHGVSAIIDFAFPVMTDHGRRGTADDDILLTYCPSLFIVGADGFRFDQYALKELRTSMIETTGLIVVGHANDDLLVSRTALLKTKISQKVIFRLLAEEVCKFLQLPFTYKEKATLCPIKLNDILTVDISKTDKFGPQPPQSPVTSQVGYGRRVTISGGTEECSRQTYKKRKLDSPLHSPTPMSYKMPLSAPINQSSSGMPTTSFLYGNPPPRKSLAGSRQHFEEIMKSVAVPEDTPQRTFEGQKRTQVEKGDLRDPRMFSTSQLSYAPHRTVNDLPTPRSPGIPPSMSHRPQQPTTSSKTQDGDQSSPIDPASISLS